MQSDDHGIAIAWGLEADHAVSFAYMMVYHLGPLLAFGFRAQWVIKFPGDWQTAAVPVVTALALLAILWVPCGKHAE
jgi:tetrahydromethanopterin S-methyltransferase subunit E